MRIVPLNCWVGRAGGALFDFIKAVNADVYCLQEVSWSPEQTPTYAHFRYEHKVETIKHHTNIYDQLCELLPDHIGSFWPNVEFDVYDDEGRPYPERWGLATFVRKKYVMLNSCSPFVCGDFWSGLKDPPLPARVHAFELLRPEVENELKNTLVIAHMHGTWEREGKKETPARDEQFANLEKVVTRMTTPGHPPSIVCGDFNVLPDSKYFNSFRRMGFRELVTEGNFPGTRTSLYKPKSDAPFPNFADYMLVSNRVKVKNFDVIYDPEVSDHCPLVLDIE